MTDTHSGEEQQTSEEGERVKRLYDLLSGGYMYSGNGEWSFIKDVRKVSDRLVFRTDSVSYESIDHQTRQEAYDRYDDNGTVIVHPDRIDVSEVASA